MYSMLKKMHATISQLHDVIEQENTYFCKGAKNVLPQRSIYVKLEVKNHEDQLISLLTNFPAQSDHP